jgi:ATP-dependent Clp protease ATP-binding subunit ClpA
LLEEIVAILKHRHIRVSFSKELKDYLIKIWYDPIYWARPLKRAITKFVTNELSRKLLSWEIMEWDGILLDINGDILKIIKEK